MCPAPAPVAAQLPHGGVHIRQVPAGEVTHGLQPRTGGQQQREADLGQGQLAADGVRVLQRREGGRRQPGEGVGAEDVLTIELQTKLREDFTKT